MTAQQGFPQPSASQVGEPPEKQSVRSMLNIAGIIALIFGIILIIAGIATILFIVGIVPLIFGIIDLVIWSRTKRIRDEVEKLQLTQAKHETLVWMIIGFILGGILIGIFMLIAYVKFDDLIKAYQTRATTGQQI